MIYILDYGAGNVRSIVNAIKHLGYEFDWIKNQEDFLVADKIIFPGVGAFESAISKLQSSGFYEPLKQWILDDKPFLGICVGMQCLFQSSQESNGIQGLGIIPYQITKFDSKLKSVPHIGWNSATSFSMQRQHFYFVHSYAAIVQDSTNLDNWAHSLTTYHDQTFVSSINRGNVFATQFHPEKSGVAGLNLIDYFLRATNLPTIQKPILDFPKDDLTKRIIACLDVRSNEQGDLVVTKGDQYDVKEKGQVRNMGKPVELAKRYYEEGADEITFLNITSFKNSPLKDIPMLQVLKNTSKSVFVPLTIGGGIRDLIHDGKTIPALEVAGEYFRSGADKVSIGSDAVYATEAYLEGIRKPNPISEISRVYGNQAVVISVDPKRVYVQQREDTKHHVVKTTKLGPNGEDLCWYQCTVQGGRQARDVDVKQLVTSCQEMGAGEILLNCMDQDGTNQGYDLDLINDVKSYCTIPVIASSGAGREEHFSDLFRVTTADAALAAGIFHRNEVPIQNVKNHLQDKFNIRKQ